MKLQTLRARWFCVEICALEINLSKIWELMSLTPKFMKALKIFCFFYNLKEQVTENVSINVSV